MNNSRAKKVIITGCNGQDGSYMAEYLLENTDCEVIGTTRRTSQPILNHISHLLGNPRFKLVNLDLNDVHSIFTLVKNEQPDYFINFGASTFVPDSWNSPASVMQTNAVSLIHILEAIRQHAPSCRGYSSGSSEQNGDVQTATQNELTPPRPRSIYGVSKVAAGQICKVYRESYNLYVVHGILSNHESERRQKYFVTRKISSHVARIKNALDKNEKFEPLVLGNLEAKRDWSHAEDFVVGIWKMLNQPLGSEPKEYVLSSNETHTVREFIEKALKVAEIPFIDANPDRTAPVKNDVANALQVNYTLPNGTPLVVVSREFYRPSEVELLHGDSSLARKELGWQPKVSFDQLVERMVKNDISELTR